MRKKSPPPQNNLDYLQQMGLQVSISKIFWVGELKKNIYIIFTSASYSGCWAVRSCVVSTRTRFSSAGIRATAAPPTRWETRAAARPAVRGTPGGWSPGWAPRRPTLWKLRGVHRPLLQLRRRRSDVTTNHPERAEEAGMPGSSRLRPGRPAEPGAGRCWFRGGGGGGSPGSPSTAGAPAPRSSAGWGWGPGGGSPRSGAGTWWGPCPVAGSSRTSFQVRGLPQHSADPAPCLTWCTRTDSLCVYVCSCVPVHTPPVLSLSLSLSLGALSIRCPLKARQSHGHFYCPYFPPPPPPSLSSSLPLSPFTSSSSTSSSSKTLQNIKNILVITLRLILK